MPSIPVTASRRNADFAQQVLDEGLVWIGPPPSAIATMGDKQAARSAVTRHGVPLIPGSEAGLRDEDLGAEADRIGYPLLVKAVAGGGGWACARCCGPRI